MKIEKDRTVTITSATKKAMHLFNASASSKTKHAILALIKKYVK